MVTDSCAETQEKTQEEEGQEDFQKLNLPEPVLAGIRDAGFEAMTPIQSKALPLLLAGKDLCGQAQTGTGKTACFLVTILSKLLGEVGSKRKPPLSLILAPTRELALQIYAEGKELGAHTGLRFTAVYGGEGFRKQEDELRAGVDVVVGTPGRLLDFCRRRILDLSRIRFLVIDESDRLLDMGFWDELYDILRRLPPAKNRQSMLFSATLDGDTRKLASAHMNRPVNVIVKPEQVTAEGIEQMIYYVSREQKFPLLLGIFAKEDVSKALIFANQKVTVTWIVKKFSQHGIEAGELTGDIPQNARNRVLEQFKQGKFKLLVASDVASRGLHIDDVTHIINFDVPQDPEDYVHRIGRTARAGKKGKAYTLACDEYCMTLPDVEALLGTPLPYEVPYDEDYGEDKTPDFTIRKMIRQERRKKEGNPRHSGQNRSQGQRPGRGGGSGRPPNKGGSRGPSSGKPGGASGPRGGHRTKRSASS
jgi:ATP-dependent RNA helicase RhlB